MKNRTTSILAGLALGFEALGVLATVVILIMQNTLMEIIDFRTFTDDMIIPFGIVTVVLGLIIYILFFMLTLKGQSENGKILAIILVVAFVFLGVISVVLNYFSSYYYGHRGEDYIAKFSIISSYISTVSGLLSMPAGPLFYIALGRYTLNPASFTKAPEKKSEAQISGNETGPDGFVKY
jgi:hypothetical protein